MSSLWRVIRMTLMTLLRLSSTVGMGEGPKRTLELVDYRLESRPLTDPRPRSLGLDLDLTQNRA